jgi:calcineurin-like phosphoesterase family protein
LRRPMRAVTGLALATLALLWSLPTPSTASPIPVPAAADSFVLSGNPNANRGGQTVLRAQTTTKYTYVRFEVPALPDGHAVAAAILRIAATTGNKCSLGVEVLRSASDDWGEKTITWLNQPGPTGSALDTSTWSAAGSQDFDVTAAVPAAGPVSFLIRQAPGCTTKADVVFSSRESGTAPQLLVETEAGTPPTPACADGLDNDGDGSIDHPADPGCTDAADVDETDPPPPPPPPPPAACADGLDNDGDGLVDHPDDPGCSGPGDEDETDPIPPPADAPVVAAAGDIACDPVGSSFDGTNPLVCQHRATAGLLASADVVLPLGDLQYPDGSLEKLLGAYDPSWGVHADRTFPSVGNHEYKTPGAQGYFDYWASKARPTGDPASGYYSFDAGAWHLISLNSNCTIVPCAEGTVQNDFLEQDLAATSKPCILAYWHHPYFNSGAVHGAGAPSGVKALLDDLHAAGADLVLNGHEHNYQRYAKQTPSGQASATGFREFVVGTGGRSLYAMLDLKDPNYEVGNATDFGVLRLTLGEGAYWWEFVSISGQVLDAGGPVACN